MTIDSTAGSTNSIRTVLVYSMHEREMGSKESSVKVSVPSP
jgi:hypothetical protein